MGLRDTTRLEDHLSGRDNNLNLIRVIAAAAVLVSHAFPIALGEGAEEPLKELTGMSLGSHAVAVFFVLSGLLIARSFDRSSSHTRFLMARTLRLFPALLVILVLTVFVGATITNLGTAQYLTSPGTLTYIPRNLSLAFLQYPLPGVFTENPMPGTINGSLWTLFYEVVCYMAVFALGLMGFLRRRAAFTGIFLLIALAYVFSVTWSPADGIAYRLDKLAQLGFPFALGTFAYVWRDKWIVDWRIMIGLWVFPFVVYGTAFLPLTIIVAVGYSLFWLGFIPKGALLNYNRLGDYSYGIYIYAFPVQQSMMFLFPGLTPFQNMAAAAPVTVLLAAMSWHFVEEGTLAKVRPWADQLTTLLERRDKNPA